MTESKKKYLLENLKLSEEIVAEIEKICDEFNAEKYAVWIGKEAKKNSNILFCEELQYIFDWAHSTGPNILQMSFEIVIENARKWHLKLAENSKHVVNDKSVDPKRVIYQCSDDKHFFYNLNPGDLKLESEMMGHCVGTNSTYGIKMQKNRTRIISLRDENNQAHVTIEIDLVNGNTGQISWKGNAAPISKYNDFITELGIYLAGDTISEDDMETLKKLSKR